MSREIELSQGQVAIVDDEDYVVLSSTRWYALWNVYIDSYYAVSSNGTSMAREIMGLKKGDRRVVHHKNGNTLLNTKDNLEVITAQQHTIIHREKRGSKKSKNILSKEGILEDTPSTSCQSCSHIAYLKFKSAIIREQGR